VACRTRRAVAEIAGGAGRAIAEVAFRAICEVAARTGRAVAQITLGPIAEVARRTCRAVAEIAGGPGRTIAEIARRPGRTMGRTIGTTAEAAFAARRGADDVLGTRRTLAEAACSAAARRLG